MPLKETGGGHYGKCFGTTTFFDRYIYNSTLKNRNFAKLCEFVSNVSNYINMPHVPNSRKKWWLCLGIIKKRKWIDGSKDDLSHKCYYSNLQAASNLTCFRCWPTNFAGGPHHNTHCSKKEYYYKYCTSPTIFYIVCLEKILQYTQ